MYPCSIYAMNGKSVEIDNTDAEGRLVLAGECAVLFCIDMMLIKSRCVVLWFYDVQTT